MQNHQHGAASIAGEDARLVTKYGGPVSAALSTLPTEVTAGRPMTITYSLKDAAQNPLEPAGLSVTHERLMHLIVVSSDLNYFSHIHPLHGDAGRYSVQTMLPAPGRYVLFNEFVTAGGVTQIERNEISTQEAEGTPEAAPRQTPAAALGEQQKLDDLSVTITTTARLVRRRIPTTFTLHVARDGKPVTDLEPYLGAAAHVVIISEDTRQFDHTHGEIPGQTAHNHMEGTSQGGMGSHTGTAMHTASPPANFGPNVTFLHTFMQPGAYRVWAQFGHGGKVLTAEYRVQVEK